MSVTIYGASDDLIEVEGDIREEFNPPYGVEEEVFLAFSNGTVLRIKYTNAGVWRIAPVIFGGELKIEQAPEDNEDNYSDRAFIGSPILWVVMGTQMSGVRK